MDMKTDTFTTTKPSKTKEVELNTPSLYAIGIEARKEAKGDTERAKAIVLAKLRADDGLLSIVADKIMYLTAGTVVCICLQ